MSDNTQQLLASDDVEERDGCSKADLNRLIDKLGTALPESIIALWRRSDGIDLPTINGQILGLSEIVKLQKVFIDRGYLPIFYDEQSNYAAVALRDPLAFRILWMPHDDGPRLIYRDFDAFLGGLLKALEGGEFADMYFHDVEGDYAPDAARTDEDQVAARALIAKGDSADNWNFATQLLDASNLTEWNKLLETDHFVRRDVVTRMRRMQSPEIVKLLRLDQAKFNQFAEDVARAARDAGLDVGERKRDCLNVGGNWMNLEAFFYRRNIPDAMPRIVMWFHDLIAKRNPHDRPNHFMTD